MFQLSYIVLELNLICSIIEILLTYDFTCTLLQNNYFPLFFSFSAVNDAVTFSLPPPPLFPPYSPSKLSPPLLFFPPVTSEPAPPPLALSPMQNRWEGGGGGSEFERGVSCLSGRGLSECPPPPTSDPLRCVCVCVYHIAMAGCQLTAKQLSHGNARALPSTSMPGPLTALEMVDKMTAMGSMSNWWQY